MTNFGAIKKKLGDLLVDVGIISAPQLKQALESQKRNGGKLGTVLAQMGLINEEVMLAFLGKQCGVSYISLSEYGEIPPEVIRIVPESIVRHQNLIPISSEGKVVTVAMADPFNVFAIDDIKLITGYDAQVVIASESDIRSAIDKYFGIGAGEEGEILRLPANFKKSSPEKEDALLEKTVLAPLFSEALKAGAVKIFFEPSESFTSVRYRVDGYLKEQMRLSRELASKITDYFERPEKYNCGVNSLFGEYHTNIDICGRKTALNVSILATHFGDSVSVEMSDKPRQPLDLNKLGFEPETLSIYKMNIEMPNGLILITGPAGSGKSQTMYSTMKALNYPDRKILVFEKKTEFVINGVIQVCIPDKPGMGSGELEKILRAHEPDIVFIENVLEGDNALFAVNTALTGRTVFTTMNTDSSLEAVTNLIYKGVPPALLASSLVMISHQKLMRIMCCSCKQQYELPAESFKQLGYEPLDGGESTLKLKKASGCPDCNNSGYEGRVAVFEIIEPDEKIKNLIAEKAPESVLEDYYHQKRFPTMAESALRKVISGISSVEEFLRLTKIG